MPAENPTRFAPPMLVAFAFGCGPFSAAATGAPVPAPFLVPTTTTTTSTTTTVASSAAMGTTYMAPPPATSGVASPGVSPGDVVRYRLPLSENSVDPAGARHCYVGCRLAPTEEKFLACISECPGFEVTVGESCSAGDGPPRSACVTHRVVPLTSEPDPGLLLVAVIADVALYIGLASMCQTGSCTLGWY